MRVVVVFSIVVCCLCLSCLALPQSSTISYQVHSYNDLREWPQILRKGTTYFKVDPHYMPASFCSGQVQVPSRQQQQQQQQQKQQQREQREQREEEGQGCLVLSHDTPVPGRQYNSTYSILQFIADPKFSAYYQNGQQRVYIFLCFKLDSASPCDGSPSAMNWTAVVDAFFDAANTVVASKGLNVEFVLDGSASPTNSNFCLINKWRPWVATWLPGDSDSAPYSNNATLGLDRFQVFNPPASVEKPSYYIDMWKPQNYGKFSSTNYSYLIWEPSDQSTILEIADSYVEGPIHSPGFRFAINIDPVQLQVFAGSRSGNAWNYDIVTSGTASLSSPSVSVVSTTDLSSFYIIATFLEENTSYYSVSMAPAWNSTSMGYVDSLPARPVPNNISILSLHNLMGTPYIYASQFNGSYAVLAFNETTLELSEVKVGQLTPCADCDSSAVFTGDLNSLFVMQIVNGGSSCALQLQVWKISDFTQASTVGPAQCIQNATTITSYSLSVTASQQGESFCNNGYFPGIVAFSDTINQLYSSFLCVNINTGEILVNGGDGSGVVVDVGTDPSVSVYQHNGELVVMQVHTDGFCWNSEINNKQPTPATCSNTPYSVPYVLNYNFGSFDQWATHILNILHHKNQSYNLDSIFSSCHPTILHGVYDSGHSPQVTLFSAKQGNDSVLLHAEIHMGLPKNYNIYNSTQCGFAAPTNGALMLDSWIVNKWVS